MSLLELFNLIGALGLFLYGMKTMSDALLSLAGHRLRHVMAQLTGNRFKGMLSGVAITGMIQSSSATTLMVVSFVTAQLLTLPQAISVIMGANIGTTFTAWLISIVGFKVKVSVISLPLIALGMVLLLKKNSKLQSVGQLLIGFALLFLGLEFLKDSLPAIEQSTWMSQLQAIAPQSTAIKVIMFVAIGTVLTLILQSSSATMAITLVAAVHGVIDFPSAAAMVLGENIGTTITANLAAIIGSREAKQAALAHFLFNFIGVVWVSLIFTAFLSAIDYLMTSWLDINPMQNASDIPVGLSIFHSSFNIINTFLLIGFLPLMVKVVQKIIPPRPEVPVKLAEPQFLDDNLLKYPETAIHCLLRETRRLYRATVFEAITHAFNLHREDVISSLSPKQVIEKSSQPINIELESFIGTNVMPIYQAILDYTSKIQNQLELSPKQHKIISDLQRVVTESLHVMQNAGKFRHDYLKVAELDSMIAQQELDELRTNLVVLLRSYRHWTPELPLEHRKQDLRKMFTAVNDSYKQSVKRIEHLIRQGQISVGLGAILLNCSSYLFHMSEQLLNGLKILARTADDFNDLDKLLTRNSNKKPADEAKAINQ